ncbi:MAG: cupin domain-containing protein [Microcoleaceae cyanobacterium]
MLSLAELLQPITVEDFFQDHWAQRAIALSRKGQRNFESLFSWEQLNTLLNFHQIQYPDLKLAMNGTVLNESENEKLLHWCRQGATLIVGQVHKRLPEVSAFAHQVQQELGERTQVNAYCSWSSQQGFQLHYDTHEVFALQVTGTKQWYVYPETFKAPLPSQRFTEATPPEGEPYLKCVLHPGDVLYVPRGHWHYAVTVEAPSIHLTLGVHCKTGVHFVEWLATELSHHEIWRKSLPVNLEAQPAIQNLVQQLRQYLTEENVSDAYHRYLKSLRQPTSPYTLPYQVGVNLFPQGVDTQFQVQSFQTIEILAGSHENHWQILASGKEVSLMGVSRTMVEKLFSQAQFSGWDVTAWFPEFDWQLDLVPLLTHLVQEGIIFVDTQT